MSGDRRRRESSRFQPFRAACECTRDRHVWQVEERRSGVLVNVAATCEAHLGRFITAMTPRVRDAVTVRRVPAPVLEVRA